MRLFTKLLLSIAYCVPGALLLYLFPPKFYGIPINWPEVIGISFMIWLMYSGIIIVTFICIKEWAMWLTEEE